MRSIARKAEWPSFMWKTFASTPSACERADAADAEQQLLADAVLAVAGVERVGEHLDLEQVERDGADVLAPDVGGDRLAVEVDLDGDVLAVQAERLGIDALVLLGLATGVVDALREVAAAVEEPDADERHAELGRRLQVVAGEDAEAAAVDRQRLLDPELHREVGDAGALVRVVVGLAPPGALLAVHAPRKLPIGPTRSGVASPKFLQTSGSTSGEPRPSTGLAVSV